MSMGVCGGLISLVALQATPAWTVPDGMADPGRSVWIEFTDPTTGRGLMVHASAEGVYRPMAADGVPAMTVDPTQNRLLYLLVEPWFTASDVELGIEYFDSGTGQVDVVYDSLDESVSTGTEAPGAWKAAAGVIACEATDTWRRAVLHLPDARFARCCNGADLRLDLSVEGDFPIRAIWIAAVTDEPPLPAQAVEIVGPDGAVLSHQARPDERYVLQGDSYELVLSPGGLVRLVDRKSGEPLVDGDVPRPLAEFTIKKGPLSRHLETSTASMPGTIRVSGGAAPTAIEYEWGFEKSLRASLRVEKVDDELTRWTLRAADWEGSPHAFMRSRFPVLRGLHLGASMDNDWFVAPGYGRHGTGVWHDLTAEDPGTLGMAINWLAAYDDTTGLGLLLDAPDERDVATETKKGEQGIDTSFLCHGPSEEPILGYLLVHGGDWHHVADVYRDRIGAAEPQPEVPPWALDCDGWDARIGNDIDWGFSFIPHHFARYAKDGLRLLDVYRAMYDGPWGYCGVYPYPNPWYGTPEELREANQRVRDQGGRTVYYINYQLSLPDGPDVKRIGPAAKSFLPADVPPPYAGQHGAVLRDRSYTGLPQEQLGTDRKIREWSDRDLFWAKWYVRNLAVDGIYWDQLSCILWGTKETAWNLQRITDECRKLEPDFVTGGEGVGEAHGRWLTYGLASATFHRTELYRYTFPDHLVMDGTANGAAAWGGGDQRFNVIFLNGCRFDNLPGDPTFRRNTLTLRQRTKQLLYPAWFRHTVGLDLTLPPGAEPVRPTSPGLQVAAPGGIQATRYQLNTESSRLILVNSVNEPGVAGVRAAVRTAGLGPIQAAWAFLWDGMMERLPFEQISGSEVCVELPTTMQSTTVLLNRCEPLVYPQVPTMVAAGTTVPVRAKILNLNAAAIEGTLRWEVPDGWGATTQTFGPIASGEAVEVMGEITIGANAPRRPYGVFCVAETEDGAGRRYAEMAAVPSPYLEWTWEADGALRTTLLDLEDNPIEASVEVVLPPECGAEAVPETQAVSVPAGGQADAVFRLLGTDTMQEAAGMRIVVSRDGDRRETAVRLFPAMCNGSFEIDRAGDGKPEYWTTYDYSGKAQMADLYPLISLDTEQPQDGEACLRIDPNTKSPDIGVCVYPVGTMLCPNTTYRATGYMRIPEGGGAELYYHYQALTPVGEPDGDGWRKYELTAESGPSVVRNDFYIKNSGPTPVWVDGVSFTIAE